MENKKVREIKEQLPGRGAYKMISQMIGGRYTPGTIRAMFKDPALKSSRKMNDDVLEAAEKLIETLNPQISTYENN